MYPIFDIFALIDITFNTSFDISIPTPRFTTKYISSPLIESELQTAIQYKPEIEEFIVKASRGSKEVTAYYEKEEVKLSSKFSIIFIFEYLLSIIY